MSDRTFYVSHRKSGKWQECLYALAYNWRLGIPTTLVTANGYELFHKRCQIDPAPSLYRPLVEGSYYRVELAE